MKSRLLRYAAPPMALAAACGLAGCNGSPKAPTPESTTSTAACAPAWMQTIGKKVFALPDAWHGVNSDTQGVTISDKTGSVTITVESAPPTPNASLGAAVNLCLVNQIVVSGENAAGTFYASFDEGNMNDNDSDDNNAWQPNAGEARCADQHGVALSEQNGVAATGLAQSNRVAASAVIHATTTAMNEVVSSALRHADAAQLLAFSCADLG